MLPPDPAPLLSSLGSRCSTAEPAGLGHLNSRSGLRRASLLPPSGLAQPVEHVSMIFGPHPGYALAHVHLEKGGRNPDGFLQRLLRLLGPTELAERGGETTVCVWTIGI
jgi:hypothetical protein